MKISGHLTESTFERYNIVDSTDLHEAMAKVEKYFDGSRGKSAARCSVSRFFLTRPR
jgi:hypothetical protein